MKHQTELSALLFLIGLAGALAYPTSCEGVPENETVLLPNPGNCSTFIECTYGEPVVLACPEGLQWNDIGKYCDYPELANCKESLIRAYTTCNGVPSNIDVLLPNPADCGSYIQCVHGSPLVRPCPSGLHWSVGANRCEWPELANCRRNSCENVPETQDVLLPNPENCGTYIQCVHQKPVVRPCPSGLHWSVKTNRCDWPNIAQCSIPSRSFKSYPDCLQVPHNETVLLANPKNCSTFILCVHKSPEIMVCPQGLQWNDLDKQCDYPENANCKEEHAVRKNWTSCEGVPENETVLFPNPGNCSTFIECTYGKPVVLACPAGLQWNDQIKQCDYPENANCKEQFTTKDWTSCEGVPANVTVLLPNSGNCSTYIECENGKPVVMPCPGGLQWNDAQKQCDYPELANCQEQNTNPKTAGSISCDGVPSYIDLLLPNPADCGSYIQCVHGNPIVRPCPSGLHWSEAANRCEWPQIANCKRNSCENIPETQDVLLPNPENCGTYIQCVHQKPVIRPCPSGLHWSVKTNRCDWPSIANCKL